MLFLTSSGGTHHGVQREEKYFQQDCAIPHAANVTKEWLDRRFAGRLNHRRFVPEWSPHSSILKRPDFYLWGFLKDHVYQNNPQKTAELKEAITQQIRSIAIRVIDNFARPLQVCHQRQSAHLENIFQMFCFFTKDTEDQSF